jgi:hypothetical protein
MPISIECATHEQYHSVSILIDEIQKSPTLGLEDLYVLLSGLPGFEDEGRSQAEIEGNYVRVFCASLLTDLLAQDVAVRWKRVYRFYSFQMVIDPARRKFSVHFRDEFAIKRSIHVWALDEADAIQIIAHNGYGHAGGMTLFAKRIEKAELALA